VVIGEQKIVPNIGAFNRLEKVLLEDKHMMEKQGWY
jgi:hypothetical protein